MIGPSKRKNTNLRKRKPRDICQSIIHDRLEYIEQTLQLGHALPEDDADFVLQAYKAFGEAEHTDAEVSYLESLTPEQSNSLEDMLADLEEETKPSEN